MLIILLKVKILMVLLYKLINIAVYNINLKLKHTIYI